MNNHCFKQFTLIRSSQWVKSCKSEKNLFTIVMMSAKIMIKWNGIRDMEFRSEQWKSFHNLPNFLDTQNSTSYPLVRPSFSYVINIVSSNPVPRHQQSPTMPAPGSCVSVLVPTSNARLQDPSLSYPPLLAGGSKSALLRCHTKPCPRVGHKGISLLLHIDGYGKTVVNHVC